MARKKKEKGTEGKEADHGGETAIIKKGPEAVNDTKV